MSEYDSSEDTLKHIERVRVYIDILVLAVILRKRSHDSSKLNSPEKEIFDRVTPLLKGLTYGSDEYNSVLAEMKVTLDHHYEHNRHHPEHFGTEGMRSMTLVDLVEMFCDWCAAT